ncbi:hypothetical protein [Stenotrophomonas sp.]|uniref:hypothetical protein n=1 Tax=Stenotrophomonas sp. TaxID=69392 RepID=UPI002FCA7DB1
MLDMMMRMMQRKVEVRAALVSIATKVVGIGSGMAFRAEKRSRYEQEHEIKDRLTHL